MKPCTIPPPATLGFGDIPWLAERVFEDRIFACYAIAQETEGLTELLNGVRHCEKCRDETLATLKDVRGAAASLYLFCTEALAAVPETTRPPKRKKS